MSKLMSISAIVDKATNRIVFFQPRANARSGMLLPLFGELFYKISKEVALDDNADFRVENCINFKLNSTGDEVNLAAQDLDEVMLVLGLWSRKYIAYSKLMGYVLDLRRSAISSIPGQKETYARKERQARSFKRSGFKNIARFPLVADYAELEGIAPKVAAESIIRKATKSATTLRTAERNRMVFTKAIFRAPSLNALSEVIENLNNL